MRPLKDWLTCFSSRKTGDGNSAKKSLLRLVPCTSIVCCAFGILLTTPTRVHHVLLFGATALVYLWVSLVMMRDNSPRERASIEVVDAAIYYSLAQITLWFLWAKKSAMVNYLSCDVSWNERWTMRRTDFLWVLFSAGAVIHACSMSQSTEPFASLLTSGLDSHPRLKSILSVALSVLHKLWFEMAPLTCMTLYLLGFQVLYARKFHALASISRDWPLANPQSILLRMKQVSLKHQQFECVFGPFLFFCLCYNFLVTVYFIYSLKLLISEGKYASINIVVFSVFEQVICFAIILFISRRCEGLKDMAKALSDQLEARLADTPPASYSMVHYLQNKVHTSINEPLTACRMVVLDKQIVLAFVSSCVSFSVLFIQINNGALVSSHNQ